MKLTCHSWSSSGVRAMYLVMTAAMRWPQCSGDSHCVRAVLASSSCCESVMPSVTALAHVQQRGRAEQGRAEGRAEGKGRTVQGGASQSKGKGGKCRAGKGQGMLLDTAHVNGSMHR